LTKRERVLASIRRGPLDAIPWQFDLTSAVADRVRAYLGAEDLITALDDHMVAAWMPDPAPVNSHPVPEGCYRDAFGAVWRTAAAEKAVGDWGGHVGHPLQGPSLEGYAFPDPLGNAAAAVEHVRKIRRERPDHFIYTFGGSLFERAWALCGFENYLGYLAGETAFVEEMSERLTEYYVRRLGLLADTGIDAMRIGDDWGFQHSLMLQPAAWRRIYKPRYARLFRAAHDIGLVTMMHSCGHVEPIIPDLIEAGLDVLHPLQPESNDVRRCRREFGRDIAFWGTLGCQSTIPFGTVADVRREVRDRIDLFQGGGLIVAPAGATPTETPAENVVAIAEEGRAQLAR
jgi:uroporphyrinogen decarboxylase